MVAILRAIYLAVVNVEESELLSTQRPNNELFYYSVKIPRLQKKKKRVILTLYKRFQSVEISSDLPYVLS